MTLPDFITPEALADHLGWSARRVREVARGLGACRVMGNRMVLLPADVVIILKATRPGTTIDDVRAWLSADTAEMFAEGEAQDFATPTGLVYFVERTRQVKIGYTTDLAKRLVNFRSATTDEFKTMLTIPGTIELEAYFHKKFLPQRVAREWFTLDGPIEEFIARRNHSTRGAL